MQKLKLLCFVLLMVLAPAGACYASYDQDFLTLVEMVYGKGFLSQGKDQAIKQMFTGIELKGKKALDIGCGLGGLDLLLASQINVDIVGVDPLQQAIEQANAELNKVKDYLKGSVEFKVLPSAHTTNLTMFKDNTFDIVFSREVLLHVSLADKVSYLKEMCRVLKPQGVIVIVDWTRNVAEYSNDLKKMMEMDDVAYCLVTPEEYKSNLQKAGFSNIQYQDNTDDYVTFTDQNCKTIINIKDDLIKKFDRQTYELSLESWSIQKKVFERKELIIGNFRAYK